VAPPRYVLIANADGKRCQHYVRELLAFWNEHGQRPDLEIVPWSAVVPRDGDLDGLAAFDAPALVRLESPGKDFDVTRLLLAAGARDVGTGNDAEWLDLPYQKGKLVRPALHHRGFSRALRGLRRSFDARPHLTALACPLAVAELFDKNATAARLMAADIPCPPSLTAPATADELLSQIRQRNWPTTYVKLATGSSACGIAVVQMVGGEVSAVTSVAQLADGFYNTRRLRRVSGAALNEVLAFLLAEGTCVQPGIPMAQIDGQNFDVRVVVIHGRPEFSIFRLSSQPMTNLHLGGRRGDPTSCRAAIPTRAWLDALDHCVAAAALYDCVMVGVDLLFERGFMRHYILEVNAFGDFFPGLVDAAGRGPHRAEVEATARQFLNG
jgi:glutathione synthase/RimK-type ligase-like ATP-grasp enzyme